MSQSGSINAQEHVTKCEKNVSGLINSILGLYDAVLVLREPPH